MFPSILSDSWSLLGRCTRKFSKKLCPMYAHSESILQTPLCSKEEEDAKFAIKTILSLRNGSLLGYS